MPASPEPPVAKQVPHTWTRPTGPVDDPFAWLADRDDPDTLAYLAAENAYAAAWSAPLAPLRSAIFEEIRRRTQETDLSVPARKAGWWYYARTVEGEDYPIHCRRPAAPDGSDAGEGEVVLLDENVEAGDSDYFALGALDVSADGGLLAWSSDLDGSEVYALRIRDLASGTDLADVVPRTSERGVAWSSAATHLFYVVPDAAMRPFQVWRHELGTPAERDVLVFEEADERFFVQLELTRSGEYVVVTSGSVTSAEVHVLPASDPLVPLVCVRPREPHHEYSLDHQGDRFVILTNEGAEDFRIVTAPVGRPGEWTELVAHEPGRRITSVDCFAGFLAVSEWADANPRVRLLLAGGAERALRFDEPVHDVELATNLEYDTRLLRFEYTSYTVPSTVMEEDVATGERRVLKRQPVLGGFDPAEYEAVRTLAPSAGGALVPVDVVRRRSTPFDGSAPAVVYGYGAYEISLPPWFSVARLSLLDRGVVFAVAHVRGGGERGRRWYLDGKLEHKQHSFDDLLAAVRHLGAEGFAAPGRIAIRGGSAGGLLVGAAMVQAPGDLAAVVAEVAFVDVVTTMSDPSLPLTVTEWEEWGDPRAEDGCRTMSAYSPYDNVRAEAYPPLLATAGLNDPRVGYFEPAKWVAKLRAVAPHGGPYLLDTELGAGHGGPSGRYDAWREEARTLAFLLHVLGTA